MLKSNDALHSLPMGFGMALLQNKAARDVYDALPLTKQMELIDGTHTIRSKQEMQRYVAAITLLR